MDEQTEAAWRKALKVRGKDWVMAELHAKPGRPDDTLYDVVFEEPYPTRQFCFQWCAEQENKVFRMSWQNYAAIFALILFLVSTIKAIESWDSAAFELKANQTLNAKSGSLGAGGPVRQPRGGADAMSNDIPTYSSSGGGASSSGSASSAQKSPPGICDYATYNTARCKAPTQN